MIVYSKITGYPDSDPVTIQEAKTALEYTGTAKDNYISLLISVATQKCEAYAGLSFATCERRVKLDQFPCKTLEILIPYGPVQSIDSFTYIDENGDTQELVEGTDFLADTHADICRLYAIDENGELDEWPTDFAIRPNAVTVEYTAGYDDVSGTPIPKVAKQAILLEVCSMFENRQNEIVGTSSTVVSSINANSKELLDQIKVYWNASTY